MEWNITKLAIIILSIMIFALLMTFFGQFSEILRIDKEMQNLRDQEMCRQLKDSSPSDNIEWDCTKK